MAFADELDTQIEDAVETQVETQVENQVDEGVETLVNDEVQGQVEDEVQGQVEDEVEGLVDNQVEGKVEAHADAREGDDQFENSEKTGGSSVSELNQERRIRAAIDIVETSAGAHRIAGELVLVADNFHRDELEKQGLEITNVIELKGLSQFLIEVKEPVKNLQMKTNSSLEFNDLYKLQDDSSNSLSFSKNTSMSSRQLQLVKNLSGFSAYKSARSVRIGVVDSGIDLNHYVFKRAKIHEKSFVFVGNPSSKAHGTAITSLLVGQSTLMRGLMPSAEIFHANVFFSTKENKQYASIKSLILALNWMVENNVEVINMSLSGPSNPILEKILAKIRSRGILLVAAAGNNGPAGAPAFPAAYKSVIAVTAVNQNNFAYFNANRGAYIDVAALGVDVFHAIPNNQYCTSTGTSYAVPFVTAISAVLLRKYKPEDVGKIIFETALDLGEKGKDDVYGYGLARLGAGQLSNSLSLVEGEKLLNRSGL